jgi:prepilin-type N-terminal cleavage/methylation domain-containing protein
MRAVAKGMTGDRGETLVELLVSIVIMGIAVCGVMGGLLTSVKMSDVHRKQSTVGGLAWNYAETVERYVAGTGYVPCAGTAAYAPGAVGYALPAGYTGYTARVTSVRYWTAANAWAATCSADLGLQQVTVQVGSPDGRATESSVVVVRKPCGQGSTC